MNQIVKQKIWYILTNTLFQEAIMDNKIIILMIVLVIVAGVGGYFVGLYQGAGNLSLNISNNSTGNVSNSSNSGTSNYKTATVTGSTAKNQTVKTNETTKKNDTSSNNNTR